jgi:Putative prokaryotic signal transducing protein
MVALMFCPQCKAEYRVGFVRCSDCHIDLVEHLPAEKPATGALPETTSEPNRFRRELDLVVIRTYTSGLDADLAKSVLDAAGIDSVIRGDYGIRPNYLGLALTQGLDLLVRAEDAEDAVKILDSDATDQVPD